MALQQQDIHISHTRAKASVDQSLNVKPKITKHVEETTEINLYGLGFGKDFLDMGTKSIMHEMDLSKLKTSAF